MVVYVSEHFRCIPESNSSPSVTVVGVQCVASAFGLGCIECYRFRNVSAKIVVVVFRVNDLVGSGSYYIDRTLGSAWMNKGAGC
jgi:hypothetical protein